MTWDDHRQSVIDLLGDALESAKHDAQAIRDIGEQYTAECLESAEKAERAWAQAIFELGALEGETLRLRAALERLRTIVDEACGMQPVLTADEALTLLERHIFELRTEREAALARVAELEAELDER